MESRDWRSSGLLYIKYRIDVDLFHLRISLIISSILRTFFALVPPVLPTPTPSPGPSAYPQPPTNPTRPTHPREARVSQTTVSDRVHQQITAAYLPFSGAFCVASWPFSWTYVSHRNYTSCQCGKVPRPPPLPPTPTTLRSRPPASRPPPRNPTAGSHHAS